MGNIDKMRALENEEDKRHSVDQLIHGLRCVTCVERLLDAPHK